MSTEFVKSGFKYVIPELLKEHEFHGISKDSNLTINPNFDNDVIRMLLSIVNKRDEVALNNQIEFNKKQQLPAKLQQTFRPSPILVFISSILLNKS